MLSAFILGGFMENLRYYIGDRADKYLGKNLVLYVYPKDNTKGCSLEAQEFTRLFDDFLKEDTIVVGISKDSQGSHEKFTNKYELKQELLSDPDRDILRKLDVVKPGKMFGKDVLKTERSTFVFDKKGNLVKEFRKVKPEENPEEVLAYVRENL